MHTTHQEHDLLNCIPVGCIQAPKFALSVVERVVVDKPDALDFTSDVESDSDSEVFYLLFSLGICLYVRSIACLPHAPDFYQ
jgi:hypothetical protein